MEDSVDLLIQVSGDGQPEVLLLCCGTTVGKRSPEPIVGQAAADGLQLGDSRRQGGLGLCPASGQPKLAPLAPLDGVVQVGDREFIRAAFGLSE